MSRKMIVVALVFAPALAAQAVAAGPERAVAKRPGISGQFKRADADGNGMLSRAEAEKGMPRLARKFDRVDADHDGRITRDEMRGYLQAKRAARTGAS